MKRVTPELVNALIDVRSHANILLEHVMHDVVPGVLELERMCRSAAAINRACRALAILDEDEDHGTAPDGSWINPPEGD